MAWFTSSLTFDGGKRVAVLVVELIPELVLASLLVVVRSIPVRGNDDLRCDEGGRGDGAEQFRHDVRGGELPLRTLAAEAEHLLSASVCQHDLLGLGDHRGCVTRLVQLGDPLLDGHLVPGTTP